MEKLGLNEIRERFLRFFESKGHLRLKSFPLVPQNDNSLLLINAGMAPLKHYFTGELTPPAPRVTDCQKCIRTLDIDSVGKDARHGTYFEMLGNFSFGDYFKREACQWAWEFITQEMKMPVDKLYVSVFLDDDEAYDIWTKEIGVQEDHMVRLGREDNFWSVWPASCRMWTVCLMWTPSTGFWIMWHSCPVSPMARTKSRMYPCGSSPTISAAA